ncbi:protein ripply1 [Brienomyrus brachyistius]|uniref:protein ripply1 n=1 Tax=Brienomyrus brachyistius TaxID=42636 RepID=UPI0020B2ED09|nr:protein ripply1 [Brienomyrus brachyistius]
METSVLSSHQNPFAAVPLSLLNCVLRSQTHTNSHAVLWRPWLTTSGDAHSRCTRTRTVCPYTTAVVPRGHLVGGKTQSFQHPVRLFWPKSKSFDYLYSDGEVLLRNFPVQATISFYDESESEDEDDNEDVEEEWEEDGGRDSRSCLKHLAHFTSDN